MEENKQKMGEAEYHEQSKKKQQEDMNTTMLGVLDTRYKDTKKKKKRQK